LRTSADCLSASFSAARVAWPIALLAKDALPPPTPKTLTPLTFDIVVNEPEQLKAPTKRVERPSSISISTPTAPVRFFSSF
jgi:hypothetical protein